MENFIQNYGLIWQLADYNPDKTEVEYQSDTHALFVNFKQNIAWLYDKLGQHVQTFRDIECKVVYNSIVKVN